MNRRSTLAWQQRFLRFRLFATGQRGVQRLACRQQAMPRVIDCLDSDTAMQRVWSWEAAMDDEEASSEPSSLRLSTSSVGPSNSSWHLGHAHLHRCNSTIACAAHLPHTHSHLEMEAPPDAQSGRGAMRRRAASARARAAQATPWGYTLSSTTAHAVRLSAPVCGSVGERRSPAHAH